MRIASAVIPSKQSNSVHLLMTHHQQGEISGRESTRPYGQETARAATLQEGEVLRMPFLGPKTRQEMPSIRHGFEHAAQVRSWTYKCGRIDGTLCRRWRDNGAERQSVRFPAPITPRDAHSRRKGVSCGFDLTRKAGGDRKQGINKS